MEKMMKIIKPKPNPQQILRDWQRKLRQECRNIERQIRDIQREEKNVQKAIKDAAKRNDMVSAKALASEIVRSRKTVNRLHENKAQLNSISMHLGESVAVARTVGHLSKSAEVMKLVNNLMKAPEVAVTMQEFSKEMTKWIVSSMAGTRYGYGWDKVSNLLYVDQPTGTGFSYTSDVSDIRHDEAGVSNDLYDFLQAFFKEHPQFAKNDFYITGESYAGHYIPAFAARVHQGNKAKEGIHINLKGFAIGNGLTDPEIQYKAYPDYALDMKLIQQSDYERIQGMIPACEQTIKACESEGGDACMVSYSNCTNVFNEIMSIVGDKNYYDIRKKCVGDLCYDFSNMETFLNMKSVRDALGVGDIDFVSCSSTVYEAMVMDWMKNLEVGIPGLLEDGIRVLIYAGEYDLICNWLGNSKWVHAMEWSGQKEFGVAPTVPFKVDGTEAGQMKNHGPLTFLKVHDAGHMVPMDQPKASLNMLRSWMQGNLAIKHTEERISPM